MTPIKAMKGLALLFQLASICFLTEGNVQQGPQQQNLTYLGELDGKEFYAEHSVPMQWWASSELCKSNGMVLATITTREQSLMLAQAVTNITGWWFWTSLRETRNVALMTVWDQTESYVDPYAFPGGMSNNLVWYPYRVCGMWDYEGGGTVMITNCDENRYTMCQKAINRCKAEL